MCKIIWKMYDKRFDYGYRLDSFIGTKEQCIKKVQSVNQSKRVMKDCTIIDNGVASRITIDIK